MVRSVGSHENVIRCVQALTDANLVNSLNPIGIIDGDYYAERYKASLRGGVTVLAVHEVESLFALPEVIQTVCNRTGVAFDQNDYLTALTATVDAEQKKRIVVERWRARLNPFLDTILNKAHTAGQSIDDFIASVPKLLDYSTWDFSPGSLLTEERDHVEQVLTSGSIDGRLQLIPGKQLLPLAARATGLTKDAYVNLVVSALQSTEKDDQVLQAALVSALQSYLPTRYSVVRTVSSYL